MCSLIANVDRLTFSVIWEVTPDAVIVDTKFCKSVIHSQAAMAYWQAQEHIDQKYVCLVWILNSHVPECLMFTFLFLQ